MTDLTALSDADLKALYGGASAGPKDIGSMSDDELRAAYQAPAANTLEIKPDVSMGEDVAKAAGSGLVQGGIGLVGLLGDVQSAIGTGAGKVAGFFGATPEREAEVTANVKNGIPIIGHLPTSENVGAAVKNVTGFEPYQPQTTVGKYVNTAAEFIPGAVAMGPGGIVKHAVGNAMKYGVVPGVASEAAGQATEGTALEPYARGAAAIATGGAAAVRDTLKARTAALDATPTREAIKVNARDLYAKAEKEGIVLRPAPYTKTVNDIANDVRALGIDKDIHPKASAALRRLEDTRGSSPSLKEIDTVRQVLGEAAKSIEPAEKFMAGRMIDKLDDFVDRLHPNQVVAGDPANAVKFLTEARSEWRKGVKAGVISDIMEKAGLNAQNFSASGVENAIRTEFRNLAKNGRKMRAFDATERKAIAYVAKGGALENAARMLGKFAPRGVVSSALSGGVGLALGGPAGAAGTLVAGEVGRQAATAMTRDSARRAEAIIRNGGKVPEELKRRLPDAVGRAVGRSTAIEGSQNR